MIDQAYAYVGTVLDKIKEFRAPITLEDLRSRAGLFKTDLNEYEIITRNANTDDSSSEEDDDELGYAVARSTPFARIHRAVDGASTSVSRFPTLFHQQACTLTSDSLSFIQRPTPVLDDPLDSVLWTEKQESETEESVYRKVANWVFSQRHFFHRFDPDDFDDIEVIDPVDLFHDSLLDEYLVLTRSSSEKRILLRELQEHAYNFLSVHEAMEKYEFDFLREPEAGTTFELSRVGVDANSIENETSAAEVDLDCGRPFLAVSSILHDYSIYDKDGDEISVDTENLSLADTSESEDPENEDADDDFVEAKSCKTSDVNELDIVSLRALPRNANFDERTSITFPTDVFDITTVIADNASDDTGSDVWEDAKDIPHWLDSDNEDQLFNHPHRPFYYYRDRIKGCYRIIGVEDETVVLFSGNDDDSIFYSTEKEDEVSALRRSHSLGLLSSSTSSKVRTKLFSTTTRSKNENKVSVPNEKRNDSGIEDAEGSIVDENIIEKSLSAKESQDLGRVTKVIRNKEPKTVTFKLDEKKSRGVPEFLFIILAVVCVLVSVIVYVIDNDLHKYFYEVNNQ